MKNSEKEKHVREMAYDLKAQLDKRKISQKEVYRRTRLSIEKQNIIMENGKTDSTTVMVLNEVFGFDAPVDIAKYKISNLVWSAKYNNIPYCVMAENCGIAYPNFKRWERALYTRKQDKCLYEYKKEIDKFFKNNKYVYVKGLKEHPISADEKISPCIFKLSEYLNHISDKELIEKIPSLTASAFYSQMNNYEICVTKEIIGLMPLWVEPIV